MKKRLTAAAALLFASVLAVSMAGCDDQSAKVASISFAEAGVAWFNSPTIIAREDAFYKKYKISVASHDVSTGLASKNAVVSGNAELGVSAATPIIFAAASREPLLVLGSYVQSTNLVSIITRTASDGGETGLAAPVGIVPSTASELALVSHLIGMGKEALYTDKAQRDGALKIVGVRPTGVVQAFNNRDINTAVIWEPLASQILAPPGQAAIDGTTAVASKRPYSFEAFIVTSPKAWAERKQDILKALRAIKDATGYLNHSEAARKRVEGYFGYPDGWLKDKWDKVEFKFVADKSSIAKTIGDEAFLATKAGILKDAPDFDYMLSAIDEVKVKLEK